MQQDDGGARAPVVETGLNLSRPDVTTDAEIEEFRAYYRKAFGTEMASFEPWVEFRPDVLKRFRMQVYQTATDESRARPLARDLAFLQYYTVAGFAEGILYEVRVAQFHGASREEILEALAIAFFHAGPRGLREVYHAAQEYLRDFEDPDPVPADRWPAGWVNDPAAFDSGLDFGTAELLPGELDKIVDWYSRTTGEVPRYVDWLGRYRPSLLKAYRGRFEHAIGTGLPKQLMPHLMIHLAVSRSQPAAIRDGVLLGRGFGMTLDEVVDAIAWGSFYGGITALSVADESVGDVLASWPAASSGGGAEGEEA